jgi:Chain length determinant protein
LTTDSIPQIVDTSDYATSPHIASGYRISDLLRALWLGRTAAVCVFALCVVAAVVFLKIAVPQYTARIIITPKRPANDLSVTQKALNVLGNLTTGRNFNTNPDFGLFNDLVTSQALADTLAQKHDMVHVIFHKQWDKETQSWIEPSGMWADLKAAIKRQFHQPAWSPPDQRDLDRYLTDHVRVVKRNLSFLDISNTYQLEYSDPDPRFAAEFVTLVYREADNILRQRREAELESNVDYLRKRLAETTIVEYRQALIQLMADQEKELMIIHSNAPFAVDIVDSASVPKTPSFPNLRLTLALTLVLGGFLAVLAGIARGTVRARL